MTASGTPAVSTDTTAVLDRLDWQLGEIGRRQHRFSWLRDTRSGEWLAVDAYYPGNRVVVVAGDDPHLRRVCEDLVPRNGLFLVTVSADDLTTDGAELVKRLRARLEIQGWGPRSDVPGGGPVSDPVIPSGPASVPIQLPPQPVPARAPARALARAPARALARAPAPAADFEEFDVPAGIQLRPGPGSAPKRTSESEGMGIGIALIVAVVLELVVGGGLIGLRAGEYVLGFGFLLDACARVLGMIVASQTGDLDAAWTSVLFGSPALWGLANSEQSDVAPVARVTAILAGIAMALGLLILVL